MESGQVYRTVLISAFEEMLGAGATVTFIVSADKTTKHGFLYHILITTVEGEKFLLVKNRGQETFIYSIRSSVSITGFARKHNIKTYCVETPDPEKYPTHH